MKISEIFENAIDTFNERNMTYGSSYKRHGEVMKSLFPHGLSLNTVDDFNRFGIFNMQVSKLMRYANSWNNNHIDSTHDLGVYSFMLEEIDRKIIEKLNKQSSEEAA